MARALLPWIQSNGHIVSKRIEALPLPLSEPARKLLEQVVYTARDNDDTINPRNTLGVLEHVARRLVDAGMPNEATRYVELAEKMGEHELRYRDFRRLLKPGFSI